MAGRRPRGAGALPGLRRRRAHDAPLGPDRPASFHAAPGRWTLHRCRGCGSAYLDPRPTQATIGLAYRAYVTHRGSHRGVAGRAPCADAARAPERLLEQALRLLPDARARHRPDAGPAAAGWLRHGRAARAQPSPATAPRTAPSTSAAQRRVPPTDAIDGMGRQRDRPRSPGRRLAREAGLDVRLGLLDEETAPTERYDAITMRPRDRAPARSPATLRACLRALRPGGSIWIATPNLDAAGHARFVAGLDRTRPAAASRDLHARLPRGRARQRGLRPAAAAPGRPPGAGFVYRASDAIRRRASAPMSPTEPLSGRLGLAAY